MILFQAQRGLTVFTARSQSLYRETAWRLLGDVMRCDGGCRFTSHGSARA